MELSFRSLFNENIFPDSLKCMTRWDSSCIHADKLTLTAGCWRYRGEGNANIVIALKDEATIIRLSKNDNGATWIDNNKKKVQRQVAFANLVFAPLLGKSYVAQVRAVYIAPDQICQLNECLERIRPSDRLHKELKVPYATSHTDFARILKFSLDDVDYCVEIKPKKGWWSRESDLSPNLCTYCLNQYLKLKKSKIAARSNYCPLDLFSGQPSRMIHAVISLLANPQNNLRIFRDGCLVYSDANKDDMQNSFESVIQEWMSSCQLQLPEFASGMGLLNNFVYLICLALLKPQSDSCDEGIKRFFQLKNELEQILLNYPVIDKCCQSSVFLGECVTVPTVKTCCMTESSELPTGCVLSKILSAQKLEDPDSKFIKKSFRKICPVHMGARTAKANSQLIDDDFSYEECPSTKCLSNESWLDEIPPGKLLPKELACTQRHLLAATVKDCSIMITFSPISPLNQDWPVNHFTGSVLEDLCGGLHRSRVGIVDLDPKPLCAVVKHNLRESKMLKAYYASLE